MNLAEEAQLLAGGRRRLQGTYADMDSLTSTLRALERET